MSVYVDIKLTTQMPDGKFENILFLGTKPQSLMWGQSVLATEVQAFVENEYSICDSVSSIDGQDVYLIPLDKFMRVASEHMNVGVRSDVYDDVIASGLYSHNTSVYDVINLQCYMDHLIITPDGQRICKINKYYRDDDGTQTTEVEEYRYATIPCYYNLAQVADVINVMDIQNEWKFYSDHKDYPLYIQINMGW